jgi:hypothetical protein
MRKPGQATMLWIHFGLAASAVIASLGGLLPIPFGIGPALAVSAKLVTAELSKKEKDQEDSMTK